jgi:hypothetical protein
MIEVNTQFLTSLVKFIQRADLKPLEIPEFQSVMAQLQMMFEAANKAPEIPEAPKDPVGKPKAGEVIEVDKYGVPIPKA